MSRRNNRRHKDMTETWELHRTPPPPMRTGALVSLMMRPYSSSTWTMTSVGAALTRLASIGTLFWSSLMP